MGLILNDLKNACELEHVCDYVNNRTTSSMNYISTKKELSAKYLYLWALTQNITGTGTTQQQLTVPIFRKTPISIPSDTKLKQFNSIADPLFSQIESNKKENIKLSTLRDTLLPKLMSGELSVEEVSFD